MSLISVDTLPPLGCEGGDGQVVTDWLVCVALRDSRRDGMREGGWVVLFTFYGVGIGRVRGTQI